MKSLMQQLSENESKNVTTHNENIRVSKEIKSKEMTPEKLEKYLKSTQRKQKKISKGLDDMLSDLDDLY